MFTALEQMTVDEFLSWAEGREGRWELHDGVPMMISSAEPVMMSPERAAHIRTKFSAAKALDAAVAAGGCRAKFLQTVWQFASTRGQPTNRTHQSSVVDVVLTRLSP